MEQAGAVLALAALGYFGRFVCGQGFLLELFDELGPASGSIQIVSLAANERLRGDLVNHVVVRQSLHSLKDDGLEGAWGCHRHAPCRGIVTKPVSRETSHLNLNGLNVRLVEVLGDDGLDHVPFGPAASLAVEVAGFRHGVTTMGRVL